MNIPQESYKHIYAKDRMKAEESMANYAASLRLNVQLDEKLEEAKLEISRLRILLIVAMSYGAIITMKLWGLV